MILSLWLLCAALLVLVWLLAPSAGLACAAGVWLLVPLLSWTAIWLCRGRLRPEMLSPATVQKGGALTLRILLHHPRWLPLGRADFQIEAENTVTGERMRFSLHGSDAQWILESRYCGCLRLRLSRLTVHDAFGVLPLVLHPDTKRQICVLPETFPVCPDPVISAALQECREYDPGRKGTDRTETYQVRDYVPGDSLRQIHWKLSGKAGRLIVREPARPIDHSLCVFVARQQAEPAFADAQMEAAVSVCQALENQPFYFMWNEDVPCGREISGTESLLEALTELMSAPAQEAPPQWETVPAGTVLYFCCQEPEMLPENAIAFVCSAQAHDARNVIAFTPENLREKLRKLTWSL